MKHGRRCWESPYGKPRRRCTNGRRAAGARPDDAWDLAGRILAEKGESAEAMYNFERAIRLRPGSASHLYDHALALARADRFDEARDRAEAALRADGNLAEAHELLGGLFERKRQLPEAAREYRRALELRPDLRRVNLRLENVLQQLGAR